jgi:hypothetical protein
MNRCGAGTFGATLRLGIAGLALFLSGRPAAAEDPPSVAAPGDADPVIKVRSDKTIVLFPPGDVFPVYVADPDRSGTALGVSFYTHTEIFDSSGVRTALKVGGRFGILRLDPAGPGGRSWQASIDSSFDGQFDSHQKLANIGWDGNYGLTVTTASGGPWSFKLALLHCSAHVGDEYAERTGRQRVDYTRDELSIGFGHRLSPRWRAYGEVAVAYHQLSEEQAPWRAQAGLEYESRPMHFGDRFAWYVALDVAAWQERDGRLDVTLQGGIKTRMHGRTWRFGGEYSNGRPALGEFFQDTEARFTLGLWIDL